MFRVRKQCSHLRMATVSSLDSILVDVKPYAVDMHTHRTISTYVCSMACVFFYVSFSTKSSSHHFTFTHSLFHFAQFENCEVDGQ